jgi:hypothetical protein
MAVTMQHMTHDGYLEVHASGKLDRHDYETLVPEVEQLIREEGKLRVVFVLDDFHGWTAGGLWEDVKFDVRHFDDVDRLAIVGDQQWHARMAGVCRLFTTAEVKYFDRTHVDEARQWVRHVALERTPRAVV